jgi:bifunctional N-acetylglucosamine-1-phosphate-uridyltransferase/glucosamine-1-phosphate-acetyltransferase GlmU-like protein
MLSVIFEDPSFWAFGRVVRDEKNEVKAIIEQKDCAPEQALIKESNPGFYIFDAQWLWANIDKLRSENAQREYYLTDLIAMAIEQGKRVVAAPVSEENEALGINTPEQLKQAESVLENRQSISNN